MLQQCGLLVRAAIAAEIRVRGAQTCCVQVEARDRRLSSLLVLQVVVWKPVKSQTRDHLLHIALLRVSRHVHSYALYGKQRRKAVIYRYLIPMLCAESEHQLTDFFASQSSLCAGKVSER